MFLRWRLRVDLNVASSTDIVLLDLGERVLGLFGVILGLCLAHIFFHFFFLPKGYGTDLSYVCFFQYIPHYEGIGGVLQS